MSEQTTRHPAELTLIASSGQTLAGRNGASLLDFSPYVAAMNDAGQVVFQAACQRGIQADTGIFLGDGMSLHELRGSREGVSAEAVGAGSGAEAHAGKTDETGVPWQFISHPALNDAGDVSVYAEAGKERQALLLWRNRRWISLAASGASLRSIGPLGPTMNAAGAVAFRAQDGQGLHGIYLADHRGCHLLANGADGFVAFHGLPVVNTQGSVLFRADRAGGVKTICHVAAAAVGCPPARHDAIVDNTGEFADLSLFPMLDSRERAIFAATRRAGGAGIYCVDAAARGKPQLLLDSAAALRFQSLRGALINRSGPVAFFATPCGGELGIYRFAPETGIAPHRVLALGDELFDSQVTGFALNPVSCNERGQLAIRVALADGRALILRAESPSSV